MIYTVKSKKELDVLIDVLTEEGISLTYDDPKVIQIQTETDKEFDVFTNILAFYISDFFFGEQLKSILMKKGQTPKKAEKLVEKSLSDFETSQYFYQLTRIIVKEYFKKMEMFNIESFLLFNLKGFKEEVKRYAENLVDDNDDAYYEEFEFTNQKERFKEEGVQEFFSELRNRAEENGLNLKDYKELHIFQQENRLLFKNKKGVLLDDEFFLDYLESSVEFEIGDETENSEIFEGALISSVLIHIFEINKVVVHKSVTEEAKEILLYNLNSVKKETQRPLKIVICDGCEQCE